MDFLGIGPLELVGILLILFLVMGPGDLVKITNGFNGLKDQLLRVINVTQQINQNKFESVLEVEEDETSA